MRIVTAADSNYFHPLLRQVVTARTHLGTSPDVFDLGLIPFQIETLLMMGVSIWEVPPDVPEAGTGYPEGYTPRSLYKPAMLKLYCSEVDENVLYMDADAWVVQPFTCPVVGIGLTSVRDVIMRAYRKTPMEEYVGPYHSGVMFLGIGRDDFLTDWARDLAEDETPSDKKSLNRVVYDYEVFSLDEYEYNSRSMLPCTKIYHDQGGITR